MYLRHHPKDGSADWVDDETYQLPPENTGNDGAAPPVPMAAQPVNSSTQQCMAANEQLQWKPTPCPTPTTPTATMQPTPEEYRTVPKSKPEEKFPRSQPYGTGRYGNAYISPIGIGPRGLLSSNSGGSSGSQIGAQRWDGAQPWDVSSNEGKLKALIDAAGFMVKHGHIRGAVIF